MYKKGKAKKSKKTKKKISVSGIKVAIGKGVDAMFGGTVNGKYVPGRQLASGALKALPGELKGMIERKRKMAKCKKPGDMYKRQMAKKRK